MIKKKFIRPSVSVRQLDGETILSGSDSSTPTTTTPNETPEQKILDWGTGGLKG